MINTVGSRFDVRSPDGTALAVWVDGEGPPLVMVHGSLQDHTISAALVGELRAGVSTFAMDRRGFGASSDGAVYAIEREFEDVAAVLDAVATRAGGPVALWGHSFGANCAMGGAALTSNVSHLVLYEPSLGLAYPAGWIDVLEATLAAGDGDAAIAMVLRDVLEFTDAQMDAMRAGPEWPRRIATVPTVAREARVEHDWVYRPGQFDAITAPTLLLSGTDSPEAVKKATAAAVAMIPDARVHVLDGHAHIAHRTDPAMVADIVRRFIAS
jgi:pimeloyl-ACP methyl ester carboxylesterase